MEEVPPVPEEKERSASYKPVFVTEITDDLHFYVQDVETGECSGPAQAAPPQLLALPVTPGPPPLPSQQPRPQPAHCMTCKCACRGRLSRSSEDW